MKVFAVKFDDSGSITSIKEVLFPDTDPSLVYCFAPDEASARKQAYNTYCARKKNEAKVRKQAQGRCACGRPQDRENPDVAGQMYKTCLVCAHRQKLYNHKSTNRHNSTPAVRDEQSRLDANTSRQRDRRAEIRLETLLAVRKAWEDARNNGQFTAWLKHEIDACTG